MRLKGNGKVSPNKFEQVLEREGLIRFERLQYFLAEGLCAY